MLIRVVLIMRLNQKKNKNCNVGYLKRVRGSLLQLYISMLVLFLFSPSHLGLFFSCYCIKVFG